MDHHHPSHCRTARTVPLMLLLAALTACTGIPDGVHPVSDFNAERYLGTWYEIYRLDHRFERGLERVTARYAARDDGGITVVNRGFNPDSGEWKEAVGKAYFIGPRSTGRLNVSFFGPFYGGYNVLAVDSDYAHALVSGPTREYLWILARSPDPNPAEVQRLLALARESGFPVDAMIRVPHSARVQ